MLSAMRPAPLAPKLHLFVCANRRANGDPLGEGCGDAGDAVFAALKAEVAKRGAFGAVWVTRTYCLGICPKRGCTVAVYASEADGGRRIFADVDARDAGSLFQNALDEVRT
jgi:predicted metal-binding protein